jgi:hypothetical protein
VAVVRLRDLLDRFRPVGAPGAPSAVGVPADRAAEATAELEPVFSVLAPVEIECADIRAAAATAAQQHRARAATRAEAVLAAARARAVAVRAEATAAAQQSAVVDAAGLKAQTEQEQAVMRARAAGRLPAYVDEVLTAVRAQIHGAVAPREDAS